MVNYLLGIMMTLLPPTITVTSSSPQVAVGSPVTITATTNAQGPFYFIDTGTPRFLGVIPVSNNIASVTTSFAVAGDYNIVVDFEGDSNFSSYNVTFTQTVTE